MIPRQWDFVGNDVDPALCISRTWFRRCGQASVFAIIPHGDLPSVSSAARIGFRLDKERELTFLRNAENGMQFGLDIKEYNTSRGGVIVLSGNPKTALLGACEHYDEYLSQNAHSIIISILNACSPVRSRSGRKRRCFFIGGYTIMDARMLLGLDNAIIQPISHRGSLFPAVIVPFRLIPGSLRSIMFGVCNVNVDKDGMFWEAERRKWIGSSRTPLSLEDLQARHRWTCRVGYPRNPFWSAHWERHKIWNDPTTSGGVAYIDLLCTQPSPALLTSDMIIALTMGG